MRLAAQDSLPRDATVHDVPPSEAFEPWIAPEPDRWRDALTSYTASVSLGRQVPLPMATSIAFATYLNGMHARIHPFFAGRLLGALSSRPVGDALNAPDLVTRIEIVLRKDGRVSAMGVVKTSNVQAFDVAVLDAVDHAQPFPEAPPDITSADGNVYMHWNFYRDAFCGCATFNARPFVLR
jgi:TonB family protein